jgi:hypothetical protein
LSPTAGPLWRASARLRRDCVGAEWIDEVARAAKPLRDAQAGELVIGHRDWTVRHFRFDGLRPTVVYDWDSVATDYETVFAGSCAGPALPAFVASR